MSTQEGWRRSVRTALSPRQAFVRWGILPPLLIALFIGFAIVEPRFASINNLTNILRQHTYLLIITLGATLYLITRNYDLSNGSVVSLTSIVVAMVMSSNVGDGSATTKIIVGTLAGLAIGLIVGIINGIVVMYFQISSFIVTLGMASIALSVALLLSGAAPVVGLPPEFPRYFGTGRLVGIPVPVLIGAVMVLAIYFLLNRTVPGSPWLHHRRKRAGGACFWYPGSTGRHPSLRHGIDAGCSRGSSVDGSYRLRGVEHWSAVSAAVNCCRRTWRCFYLMVVRERSQVQSSAHCSLSCLVTGWISPGYQGTPRVSS